MPPQFIESFLVFGFWIGYYLLFLAFLKRHMQSENSKRKMLRGSRGDESTAGDKGLDKVRIHGPNKADLSSSAHHNSQFASQSKTLRSTDSNATITERTRTFQKVDLFCPHPFLLAQQAKLAANPKPAASVVGASPDTLLSTTAFPRAVIQPAPRPAPRLRVATAAAPSQEFTTQIRRLLDLIQDMRPEELAPLAMSFLPVLVEVGRNLDHLRLNGRHMVTLGILARIILSQVPRDIRSEPAFSLDALKGLIERIENQRRPSPASSTPTATIPPAFSNTDTSPSITTPANSPALPNNPDASRASQPLNASASVNDAEAASDRRSWRHSISQRLRLPYMR
ncbi:hypothetical protein FRC06_011484 [Ceratobasidium sp. 370]|nr:hypothetical protein FRC06_011484 [Ceratobasidium sp. 370]